jgi:hypothetical protein
MNVAMEIAIYLIPLVDEVVPVHEDRVALVLHVTEPCDYSDRSHA